MCNFRNFDRDTAFLLPPSINGWLPEKHLARFIVEVIDGLDLPAMSNSYRGSGSASYHPRLLLAILVYGYATGVFSSRKLERATYDLVAFRFIAANEHPDHDTIAAFIHLRYASGYHCTQHHAPQRRKARHRDLHPDHRGQRKAAASPRSCRGDLGVDTTARPVSIASD